MEVIILKIAFLTNILTPYRRFFYDKLYEALKEDGIEFYVLVMAESEPNRNWNYNQLKTNYTILLNSKTLAFPNFYLHINNNLKDVLLKVKPNIVIAGDSYISLSVIKSIVLKKKLNFKLIFWSESHLGEKRDYSSAIIGFRELIRSTIYKRFDGFFYAGKNSLKFIKKYAHPNAKLFFVPNLIDHKKFYQKERLSLGEVKKICRSMNIPTDKFIFICPARLTKVKGIDKFIEVFKKCKAKERATIIIPGDGELKDHLQQIIADNKLDIHLIGYKDQEEMIKLYSISDSFLMPSISDPSPLTCIEALWSGLPLLISEHVGNFPEVVKVSENGYVFDYKDEDKSVDIIDKLINSTTDWRRKAITVSLDIAKNVFEPSKVIRELVLELKHYNQYPE